LPPRAIREDEVTLPALAATAAPADPAAEALHLRRLVETQPTCLMRVGLDGHLLAANQAALGLLGAAGLAEVLGTSFTERILGVDRDRWEDLVTRIGQGLPGSAECDMTDLSAARRTILLQAIPLIDHADGIRSMIVAARDTSTGRQLEAALRKREITLELDDLQKQLELQTQASPGRGGASVESEPPTPAAPAPDHASECARLQAVVEEQRVDHLALETEHRILVDNLRAELVAEVGKREQLAAALAERDGDVQRAIDERGQVEETLARQTERLTAEDENRQRLESLLAQQEALANELPARHAAEKRQLEEALAQQTERLAAEQVNRQRLESLLAQQEAHLKDLSARHVAEQRQLQEKMAEEQQLELLIKERDARQQLAQMKAAFDRTDAECQRLTAERDTHLHRAAAQIAEERTRQSDAEKALRDQEVELRCLDAAVRDLEGLAAAGRAALNIGNELKTIAEALDARTRYLLARSQHDAADRHVIEGLREDAANAGSIARQLLHAARPGAAAGDDLESLDADPSTKDGAQS
jgi:hypothetical protein